MKIFKTLKSNDGRTTKYLQKTEGKDIIETGYYDLDEHIICISTQVGCPMGCIFCATADPAFPRSFVRNLSAEEIVSQVKNIISRLKKENRLGAKNFLFSFMGMGEPFLNYENLVAAIKTLGREFPNSRMTVSTLGVRPDLIRKMAKEKFNNAVKLHLSLHAPNDKLRQTILPRAKKIKAALAAMKYFSLNQKQPCKVNYVLIKGLNDSPEHAAELAELIGPYRFTVKLSNLNIYNGLELSSSDKFEIFEKILKAKGIKTCRFVSDGKDIKAGCGQLRRHYLNK